MSRAGDLRVFGTTVLSCGCGIPWQDSHRKMKPLVCPKGGHGVVVIIQIR